MSVRKEVFRSKVLQRLYPAPKEQNAPQPAAYEQSTLPPAERLQSIPHKESDKKRSLAVQGKKVYTALPPPEGYLITSRDESVTPSDPDFINSEDSTADADDHELHKKRKRRRKKKAYAFDTVKGEISTPPAEGAMQVHTDAPDPSGDSNAGNSVCPDGTEHLSKNRKRKMKKKRHKEKLLALGLVPRARALEFTYRQGEEAGGGEGNSKEVLDFLHKTHEIYLSDRSCLESSPSLSLTAVESLFSRLSGGTVPPAEISKLCRLRTLVKDEEMLKSQLQEFRDTSTLPADEVSVVCVLIEYWLTEILPLQKDQGT